MESQNKRILRALFESSHNQNVIMCRSSLYERAGTESQVAADNEEDRQLSAKLHCLYGAPASTVGRRSLSTHPYARSRVYDLRNYTDNTKWGPFRDDGSMRVDWEHVESVMIVLAYNSSLCCRSNMPRFQPIWNQPFEGVVREVSGPKYGWSIPMEPEIPLEMRDPYSISGLWSRVSRKKCAQFLPLVTDFSTDRLLHG